MPKQSANANLSFKHTPVLAKAVLDSMQNMPPSFLHDGLMIDATLGGGGHSCLLLEAFSNLKIIGLDQDPNAINAARKRLEPFGSRVKLINTNFTDFTPNNEAVMVLADLGVSSPQLDVPERGFSFLNEGPLDM